MKKLEELKNEYGIKTVINLKSENRKSAYFLFEEEKCRELGLKLINVNIRSREMPTTYNTPRKTNNFLESFILFE
jgi:hypothetical protein